MSLFTDVWLAIPSARPAAEIESTLDKWRTQGYHIALWRDDESAENPNAEALMFPKPGDRYPGYGAACNELVRFIIEHDPAAQWIICAGDDTEPDLNHTAEEIAAECTAHFSGTFGVMQPTGDRWGDSYGAYIDRICGSSWFGREFCKRIYGGKGLWWPEYFHMFADEEMFNIANNLGVLWQRRDLIHLHNHWGRTGNGGCPEFAERANSSEEWGKGLALFNNRKAGCFPGSEPL